MKIFPALFAAVFLCGCFADSTRRSDEPLSREQALKKVDFPLPPSAHDIYFVFFAGGLQDLESYTRFDVAPQDLEMAVESLVSDHNRKLARSLPYPKSGVSTSKIPPPRREFLPMPWWSPELVSKGYFRGEPESYALQILVDQEHSRIYIHQND